MPKTKLSDILKHSKIKIRKFDPNDPDFIAMIQAIIKEKKMAKERKRHRRRKY